MIHISNGNTKMGLIPSWSLPPVKYCYDSAICWKRCYARRVMCRHRNTRNAWTENGRLLDRNIAVVFDSINSWLRINEPRFFRIHVAGDFYSTEYIEHWLETVRCTPSTRFFTFSKAFELLRDYEIPTNLNLFISYFPDSHQHDNLFFPEAYAGPKEKHREIRRARVREAFTCPGNCLECRHCLQPQERLQDVHFTFH